MLLGSFGELRDSEVRSFLLLSLCGELRGSELGCFLLLSSCGELRGSELGSIILLSSLGELRDSEAGSFLLLSSCGVLRSAEAGSFLTLSSCGVLRGSEAEVVEVQKQLEKASPLLFRRARLFDSSIRNAHDACVLEFRQSLRIRAQFRRFHVSTRLAALLPAPCGSFRHSGTACLRL